jgi:hypothetical protein
MFSISIFGFPPAVGQVGFLGISVSPPAPDKGGRAGLREFFA